MLYRVCVINGQHLDATVEDGTGSDLPLALLECAWASSTLLSELTKILIQEVMGYLEFDRVIRCFSLMVNLQLILRKGFHWSLGQSCQCLSGVTS